MQKHVDQIFEDAILKKGMPQFERIDKMRSQIINTDRYLCVERAKLITDSYKETEGYNMTYRRAKGLEKLLTEMSVYILPGELLVGMPSAKLRGAEFFPEMAIYWLEDELDIFSTREADPHHVLEEDKKILREQVFPYWRGKTFRDTVEKTIPDWIKNPRDNGGVYSLLIHERAGLGHVIPKYTMVLEKGLLGIKKEIEEYMASIELASPNNQDVYDRINYWEAMIIGIDAAVKFAERYAREAERLAADEKDIKRSHELLKIAEVCRRVPAYPAKSWHEALQSIWFCQLIPQIESNVHAVSPGRFDQYMMPYLAHDLESGAISETDAQELLECFFLKLNHPSFLTDSEFGSYTPGYIVFQNLTVGGVDTHGNDATNKLSYMCLEAFAHVHLHQPNFSVRLHKRTPDEFFTKTMEVVKLGGGMPQLLNDEQMIPSFLNRGVSLEDARNYAPHGCEENQPDPNFSDRDTWGRGFGGYMNMPKMIELALNNGINPMTGIQVGPKTGDATKFTDFEQLFEAVEKQDQFFMNVIATENNMLDVLHARYAPITFLATLLPSCIREGKDPSNGPCYYNWGGLFMIAAANSGDSLTAIKKLVFDDKKITMQQLLDALKNNWVGYENIRKMCLESPKYGNDDDYADSIIRRRLQSWYDTVESFSYARGGKFHPGCAPVTANLAFGEITGATPDGRQSGSWLADGISPINGMDVKGPTATMKSVGKIEQIRLTGGVVFNQKFSPTAVESEDGMRKWMDLTRTYFDLLDGAQVQYNIVSRDTLLNAQKRPNDYKDLVVRVAGYSGLFVELKKNLQDSIIERTEQDFRK